MGKETKPRKIFKDKMWCNIKEKSQDFAWYNENPQAMEDAASYAYSNALGLPIERGYNRNKRNVNYTEVYPGIAVIEYAPIPGISRDGNSPVNVASRLVYSFIRHRNSGSRNYEAPDYFMYLLSVGSLHAIYCELVRVYGLLNIFSYKNRYVAKAIVSALGYDYDNLLNNKADFRAYINTLAIKINTFAVPKNMHLFDRYAFLSGNIFKDSKEDKAQLYAYNTVGYYQWDGTSNPTGTQLNLTPIDKSSLSSIQNSIDEFLNALLNNEDLGLMSGDTLKAFGNDGIRQLQGITADHATIPYYDESVLAQIHNTVLVGALMANFSITQNESGVILVDPEFSNTLLQFKEGVGSVSLDFTPQTQALIDSGMETPDAAFTCEATRNIALADPNNPRLTKLDTCGSEIHLGATIYSLNVDGNAIRELGVMSNYYIDPEDDYGFSPTALCAQIAAAQSVLSKFDWFPFITFNFPAEGGYPEPFSHGEIFNYTVIDYKGVKKIHEIALLSLLNVYGLMFNEKI